MVASNTNIVVSVLPHNLAFFILPDPSWIQYMDNILSTLNRDAEELPEHYMEKA